MKGLLLIVGLIALAVGLLWIGQGLGYITWPSGSFMIHEMNWTYYGAGLAIAGLIIIWLSRR